MKVSVVIPCLNEAEGIEACLRSVLLAADTAKAATEVLVADGLSTDGTAAIVENIAAADPRVKLLLNKKRTTPAALNLGIESSHGEVVIILGAHSTVPPSFIVANLSALQQHPEAACVGGVIHSAATDAVSASIGAAMTSVFGVGNARFRTGGIAGFVDTVAFGAYRREVFTAIGLFDTELERNQDDEFNYRLTKSGRRIWFDPAIECTYTTRGTLLKLARQYFQYGYWKVRVNVKHKAVTSARQLAPLFFFVYLSSLPLWCALSFHVLGAPWALVLAAPAALYLALQLWFSAQAVTRRSGLSFVHVFAAFFILHFQYGTGYAAGLWRFSILRKAASDYSKSSTR